MDRRRVIELLIFGLWLAIGVVIFIHHNWHEDVALPKAAVSTLPSTDKGKQFAVKKIFDNHETRADRFDLSLQMPHDVVRVEVKLSVRAVDGSIEKVRRLLNRSTDPPVNPRVVLRDKQPDGHWVVDFIFTDENGKEVNLAEWLTTNKLVYNE